MYPALVFTLSNARLGVKYFNQYFNHFEYSVPQEALFDWGAEDIAGVRL
jgi:hypothetical protein